MSKAKKLELKSEEQEILNSILHTRTAQASITNRARILLLKAEGQSVDQIADKTGLHRNTVLLCLRKYKEGGVTNALYENSGRGRYSEVTEEEKAWIIALAQKKPTEVGCGAKRWSMIRLTEYIREHAEEEGYGNLSTISRTSVYNYLYEAGVSPFRRQYATKEELTEEDAGIKKHELLGTYKSLSVCFNRKKTKKEESIFLLAAIDLLTGEIFPMVCESNKSEDFISYLKMIDEKYPKEDHITLLVDDHYSHTSKKTKAFMETLSGRLEIQLQSRDGRWLRIIESYYEKMVQMMLRYEKQQSKEELVNNINELFDGLNKTPVDSYWNECGPTT